MTLLRGLDLKGQEMLDKVLASNGRARSGRRKGSDIGTVNPAEVGQRLDELLSSIGGPFHRWSGQEVRQVRNALGVTLEQLAPVLGVSKNTLHRWEMGDNRPSQSTAAVLDAFMRAAKAHLGEATALGIRVGQSGRRPRDHR